MPAVPTPLRGLIAATFTPMTDRGAVDLAALPDMVDRLAEQGVNGLYVLGSTGEGVSLTAEERRRVAEAFVQAARGRVPVIVQVGCESLAQSAQLAAHAQASGADAISAVSPVYFKPDSLDTLVDSMAAIAAAAPELPFYYYHIPWVTGVAANMVEFLHRGEQSIPTLRGIKFTAPSVHEFQACVEEAEGRFEILWGMDEMLLSGLVAGARAAVGSTYNFAAPLYQRLLAAFAAGDFEEARRWQSRSQALVRTFAPYGPRGSQKAIMAMVGLDCGPPRLPIASISVEQIASLRGDLQKLGFFDWLDAAGHPKRTA